MKRAIQFFLRYPVVTLVVAALVVVVGLQALFGMPRMEDPSITIRTGLVIAAYPGATSEQVEAQVTRPIEAHLFKFPEVRKSKTFATSRPGLVIFNVELEDHVKQADTFWAKLRAELELARATELPQGVLGPLVDSDFGETVAMLIAVHGDRFGYRELRDHADKVKDELRSIREVGRLVTYGQQEEQIWITGNLGRLSHYPGDPTRIAAALNQRNAVAPAGSLETERAKVPFRTPGLFSTEEQIRKLIVDVSPTGQPVYLGDLAQVVRRYRDPEFLVRFDGQPCLLVSVEMQKGKNIVEMGDRVSQVLTRLRQRLPSDLKLDFIANQPQVVSSRMNHLGVEFLLAIGAVILVAVFLLPIRVAVIAAVAIPITMLGTLGILNAVGIELHQVSIAALIVVLGIAVDDAIVIADNYLELRDHGIPVGRAAWRSATDVLVPVLTATLTIIASFLPLLILRGSVGEFIQALPITVSLALSVSFLVALFITPFLCRRFITQGLHGQDPGKPRKVTMLDRIQAGYGRAIAYLMQHKAQALGLGALSIGAGVLLFTVVPEQFFPSAERNQFVIDLWMPQGTRIEATQAVLQRIEQHLGQTRGVEHVATFVGQSAPRFYYNVNPQQPDAAYGQMVVNTRDAKETEGLVHRLRVELAKVAPEGMAIVKELQQGDVMEAPVEFRIIGDRAETVKAFGRQVEDLLRGLPEAQFVHTDHLNDSPLVDVEVNPELANRLGLSHMSISQILAGGLEGAPVSIYWEGDRAVPVVLRIDAQHRSTFGEVGGTPMTSPLTQGTLPLAGVARLKPDWQPSRLVRRNGLPTLTVRSFVKPGHYASALQAKAQGLVSKLTPPMGVQILSGGEVENEAETFPMMVAALGISLLAIFLVLLLQFRNLLDPLVVMASIPLSLFGAMLGLVVTRNPFGFTAFMGMISLCGIVVRNAIILVDDVKERRKLGVPLAQAAMEAGNRRLRPIFLTTTAAAVGVLPMILSGSKLWGPLASVLAVGLLFSMLFTLLVVPVLYVALQEGRGRGTRPTVLLLFMALTTSAFGQHAPQPITLSQGISLALERSPGVRIAQAKVEEQRQKRMATRSDYFPQLTGDWNWSRSTTKGLISVPAGALGALPDLGPFPAQTMTFDQGSQNLSLANLTLGQPLTQLLKIRQGDRAAERDLEAAQAELRKVEHEIRYGVQQAWYGILIARQQQTVAQLDLAAVTASQEESRAAVKAGNVLKAQDLGAGASLLQARQKLQAARHQEEDLLGELRELIGFPPKEALELRASEFQPPSTPPLEKSLSKLRESADLQGAISLHEKAICGLKAARLDYVPDVSAFVKHTNQNGVPFLRSDFTSVGVQVSWNLFDWGKRRHVISQRSAEVTQARENLRRIEGRVRLDVEKSYRKLDDAKALSEAAELALRYQAEMLRIALDQREVGLITPGKLAEAKAAHAKAELEQLQASLGWCLAAAEIDRILGPTPQ